VHFDWLADWLATEGMEEHLAYVRDEYLESLSVEDEAYKHTEFLRNWMDFIYDRILYTCAKQQQTDNTTIDYRDTIVEENGHSEVLMSSD